MLWLLLLALVFVLLFGGLGLFVAKAFLVIALVALFLEILVDNVTSRATWQLMLRSAWAATLVLAGGNALLVSLWRW